MSDDFGGSSKKIKRKHKKKRTEETNLDFDAAWDSIPDKPKPAPIIEKPKEIKPEKSKESSHPSTSTKSSTTTEEKKSKKKTKKKPLETTKKKKDTKKGDSKPKPKQDGTSGTGKVSDIYSADKTTHVIEYGIKHDAIRESRAATKAIKDKIRRKREEEKRKEQEALQKHKEFLERQKKQKAELKKKNAKKNKQKPSSNDTETQSKKEHKKDDLDFSINTPRRKSKNFGGNINVPKSPGNKPKSPGIKPPKMHKMEKKRSVNKTDRKDKPRKRLSKLKDNNKMEPLINIKELQILKEENIDLKKQLKKSEFVQRKYDVLKNENGLFKEQITILNEENDMLKNENNELRMKIKQLQLIIKNNKDKDDTFDDNDIHNTYDDSNPDIKIDQKLLNGNMDSDSDNEDDKKNNNEKNNKQNDSDSSSDSSSDNNKNKTQINNNNNNNNNESESEKEDGDNNNDGVNSGSTSNSSSEEAEWEEWEPDAICDWIVSLDSKYKKYEKMLRKKLKEEEMHGSLLGDLNGNDLDRFGIKSMKHKKAIIGELGKLTNKGGSDDSDSSD